MKTNHPLYVPSTGHSIGANVTNMKPPKISALMALEALQETCTDVQKARYALRDALQERDKLVQDAVEAGIRQNAIARATGMSAKTIKRILEKKLTVQTEKHMALYDAGAHIS